MNIMVYNKGANIAIKKILAETTDTECLLSIVYFRESINKKCQAKKYLSRFLMFPVSHKKKKCKFYTYTV